MERRYCKNGNIHLKMDMFDYIDEKEPALINAYYLTDNGDSYLLASGYNYFEFYFSYRLIKIYLQAILRLL